MYRANVYAHATLVLNVISERARKIKKRLHFLQSLIFLLKAFLSYLRQLKL